MLDLDDTGLVERLQSGLAKRVEEIPAAEGLATGARRLARRRATTRMVAAGAPLVAAAAAVIVLLGGAWGGGHRPLTRVTGGGHAGVVRGQDTAYIVTRVREAIVDAGSRAVLRQSAYSGGEVSPRGALTDLGSRSDALYEYTAPDGTEYMHNTEYRADGTVYLIAIDVLTPAKAGRQTDVRTIIDPAEHTYSRTRFDDVTPATGATPDLRSRPSEVRAALSTGRVTRHGTAIVHGTWTIVLSIRAPAASGARITLFVDARTYRPVRVVDSFAGHPTLIVSDWLPATLGNVRRAEAHSIPAGYSGVDSTNGRDAR